MTIKLLKLSVENDFFAARWEAFPNGASEYTWLTNGLYTPVVKTTDGEVYSGFDLLMIAVEQATKEVQ